MQVRAKKHLGQHFLTDKNIAEKIVKGLQFNEGQKHVLEVGPGMGVLTDFMVEDARIDLKVVDIDVESIAYLENKYPELKGRILSADFLKLDLSKVFESAGNISIIGNFPYNISSQILFHVIDHKSVVEEVVGMFQKEVAERVASKPGSKEYGILSVLMQAYYQIDYLFTVPPGVFNPPPKVKSGVIRASRIKEDVFQGVNEALFKSIVKAAFNQRRKTLRNALASFINKNISAENIFDLRAERLSVEDFIGLTKMISDENTRSR